MERFKLTVQTKEKKEVVDITDLVQEELAKRGAGEGSCHLFLLHTTAALTVMDLDPGTDLDILDAFEAMIPRLQYRHPHNPSHAPDHIASALMGISLAVPVENGKFLLGTWQRIALIEFDGPRKRDIVLSLVL